MKAKFLLASALVAACLIGNAQEKTENRSINISSYSSDGSDVQIDYNMDGHRYKLRMVGSKITEMYLDGKKVAEEDYPKYDADIKKILAEVEKARVQAQKDREQAERDRQQASKDREQAEKDRQQAERDREQARKDREQAERDRKNADVERERSVKNRAQVEEDRKQAEKDREQAQKDREQAQRDRAQAEKDREQAERDRQQAAKDRAQAEEDRKLMNALIDDLIDEKLIDNRDALTSVDLSETSFTINGKEQPAAVHSRFKAKYLKGKSRRIQYQNSGNTRTMSFN